MKKFFISALLCAAVFAGAAEKNLLPAKWFIYGKNNALQQTVIGADGIINCSVKDPKGLGTGVIGSMNFATPLTGSITFGAESRAEDVKGKTPHNYCVYLDLTYADGKKLYGQTAVFSGGTHDWEKKSTTIKLAKPLKSVNFYILFRKVSGKASFRNIFFYNK